MALATKTRTLRGQKTYAISKFGGISWIAGEARNDVNLSTMVVVPWVGFLRGGRKINIPQGPFTGVRYRKLGTVSWYGKYTLPAVE